jgi:hypothetical protein
MTVRGGKVGPAVAFHGLGFAVNYTEVVIKNYRKACG